jgi:hypothetical protein
LEFHGKVRRYVKRPDHAALADGLLIRRDDGRF